jgi:hypothetical protein
MADGELVYSVESVELALDKSNPPQLEIHAKGTARTPGYTNPTLSEIIYVTPPADGMYEYDFVATRPGGMVPQVLVPIEASTTRSSIPKELKGVRVKSATNTAEAMLPNDHS